MKVPFVSPLFALILLSLPAHAYAHDSIDLTPARWIPTGSYAGNAASFTVDVRSARFDLPCAYGQLPRRPVLDEEGRFTMEGIYASRILTPAPQAKFPATFRGRLAGLQLWLQIDVHGPGSDEHLSYGPLELGQSARFFRCL